MRVVSPDIGQNAGLADRAIDRDPLARGLFHGHRDAGIVHVFPAELNREIVGQFLGCPPARGYFSDQRQKNCPVAIDTDRPAEVLHLKDDNVENILYADPVVVLQEGGGCGIDTRR
jgi:hypothetical protein